MRPLGRCAARWRPGHHRMIYIGIDPGLTGAIGVLMERASAVYDMPTTVSGKGVVKREVSAAQLAFLLDAVIPEGECSVILERTSAMPGQGVASMFSMGVSRGIVLGVLGALKVRFHEVAPQTWKRHYGLIGADKDRSRTLALQLFPTLSSVLGRAKDHNRAEALLLAEYLRTEIAK
jgi:crossover junction endodeoxyribonuclease RuvC